MTIQFRHLRLPEEKTLYLLCNVTQLDQMLFKALNTHMPEKVSRDGHWIRVDLGTSQREGIEINASTLNLKQVDHTAELQIKFKRTLSPSERILYTLLAEALNSGYPAHLRMGEASRPFMSVALTTADPEAPSEPSEILANIQSIGEARPKFDF